MSQATVSRMFLRLDTIGVTVGEGRSGRVLSDWARREFERATDHRRRNALLDGMFGEADRSELIDLLALRRAIEIEAVDLACDRSDRADHLALLRSLELYDEHTLSGEDFSRDAIEFHVALCRAAHSAPYSVIAEALYPDVTRLEPLTRAAAHRLGEREKSSEEHAAIARAVIAGDREQSRRLTAAHFDTMIRWLSRLNEEEFDELVADLNNPQI